MKSCHEFRERLSAAIEGKLEGAPLAWHEHLVGCAACRALFEAEEALDELLACLPVPELPIALAQRVLRRLASDRQLELALDHALDQARGAEAPDDLSARVLAGLGRASSLDGLLDLVPEPVQPQGLAAQVVEAVRLDALLDRDAVPEVPAGLAARVLRGLGAELQPVAQEERPVLRAAFGRMRRMAAIAAAVLIVAALWRLMPATQDSIRTDEPVRVASNEPEVETTPAIVAPADIPDPELLAALDVLEDWELLVPSDLDLLLGSLDETETELLLLDVASDDAEDDSEG